MSLASLDRLTTAHEALIRALDGNDLAAIEAASRHLADAVTEVRGEDFRPGTEARERLTSLAALAHAAQIRVNFLTDKIRRRIDAVAALRGAEPAMTYAPTR
jgi:hypothetical protein